MDEIVVIRAADLDGSVFKAVVDALNGKRTKVVHRCSAYLHGQFTRASVLKGTTLCSGLGRGVSAWDHIGGEYYLAFEEEVGGLLVFGIHKNDGGSRL